ncbi:MULTISPECIES: LptE family protein [unclassified Myroides]|uniref:LptE family protein n=1 Tax=unclassified Myroides TaxID=2642485 RepID=UPI0015F99EF1|nr:MULTISPECIES: LptE family protein [unclassified Myroides]MBB1150074.1 LptE family protein [Myroides sp. NP-2]MDM1407247.1 LptE family protein [Myroides sp. DF42-4-2]
MKKFSPILAILFIALVLQSCKYYNFTGTGKIDADSFQVNYFQNNAPLVEPGIERTFTLALQDLIQGQTSLTLTNSDADLVYEGEIVDYRISPMTATADQRAAQNRLYIAVNVRFINKKNPEDDFEKRFSFYYDYEANAQLVGGTLNTALDEIFERITQDVFNESLAKW